MNSGAGHLVVDQPEALEDGLVQVPPDDAWCCRVLTTALFEEQQRPVEGFFELLALQPRAVERFVCGRQLSGDPFLLDLELVQWHRAGVVGLEQFVTLGRQLGNVPRRSLDLTVRWGSTSSSRS